MGTKIFSMAVTIFLMALATAIIGLSDTVFFKAVFKGGVIAILFLVVAFTWEIIKDYEKGDK